MIDVRNRGRYRLTMRRNRCTLNDSVVGGRTEPFGGVFRPWFETNVVLLNTRHVSISLPGGDLGRSGRGRGRGAHAQGVA